MPTVATFDGLRVVIYPNDHRPANVHVLGNDCEAVFELNGPGESPALRENYGFSISDIKRVKGALKLNAAKLDAAWRKIHGSP